MELNGFCALCCLEGKGLGAWPQGCEAGGEVEGDGPVASSVSAVARRLLLHVLMREMCEMLRESTP